MDKQWKKKKKMDKYGKKKDGQGMETKDAQAKPTHVSVPSTASPSQTMLLKSSLFAFENQEAFVFQRAI